MADFSEKNISNMFSFLRRTHMNAFNIFIYSHTQNQPILVAMRISTMVRS